MKKMAIYFVVLVFSLCYADTEKSSCQIVDLKGAVVYSGDCQNIGSGINQIDKLSNVFFLLKKLKAKTIQKIRVKEKEISVVGLYGSDSASNDYNANLYKKNFHKALKRTTSLSEDYYLRTKLLAINGLGYESRTSASANFGTLFSYYSNAFTEKFPEDTLDWDVVFNRTSHNKFTDFVQSIYNMVETAGSDLSTLGLGILLYVSYEELKIRFASQFNPVLEV